MPVAFVHVAADAVTYSVWQETLQVWEILEELVVSATSAA